MLCEIFIGFHTAGEVSKLTERFSPSLLHR